MGRDRAWVITQSTSASAIGRTRLPTLRKAGRANDAPFFSSLPDFRLLSFQHLNSKMVLGVLGSVGWKNDPTPNFPFILIYLFEKCRVCMVL